jgi:hypothetical protein
MSQNALHATPAVADRPVDPGAGRALPLLLGSGANWVSATVSHRHS